MTHRFAGSYAAIPTPFRDGELDFDALRRLVHHQIQGQSRGIVVAGTTGESATLRPTERGALISFVAGLARGRLDVVAGVGTNDTRTSCELAREAVEAGADALLVVTPYYNRPNQRGLLRHFSDVADAVEAPIVLYNVPARTAVDLLPQTVAELARRHRNVVAIKEASGALERVSALAALGSVDVLCGEDALLREFMEHGATGLIGVVTNLVPALVAELCAACGPTGDPARAAELSALIAPLIHALHLETNPAPVKAACASLGLCSSELRPPMVPLEPQNARRLEQALAEVGFVPA